MLHSHVLQIKHFRYIWRSYYLEFNLYGMHYYQNIITKPKFSDSITAVKYTDLLGKKIPALIDLFLMFIDALCLFRMSVHQPVNKISLSCLNDDII